MFIYTLIYFDILLFGLDYFKYAYLYITLLRSIILNLILKKMHIENSAKKLLIK